jgi:hypothetical protein
MNTVLPQLISRPFSKNSLALVYHGGVVTKVGVVDCGGARVEERGVEESEKDR